MKIENCKKYIGPGVEALQGGVVINEGFKVLTGSDKSFINKWFFPKKSANQTETLIKSESEKTGKTIPLSQRVVGCAVTTVGTGVVVHGLWRILKQ